MMTSELWIGDRSNCPSWFDKNQSFIYINWKNIFFFTLRGKIKYLLYKKWHQAHNKILEGSKCVQSPENKTKK